MTHALPAEIDGRIAGIAAQLGLLRPRIAALPGGVVNRTFRLREGHHDYVLRLAGDRGALLGANCASELAMLGPAADAELAPAIVLARPEQGFIVTQHISGRTPDAATVRRPDFMRRLGGWIRRLQELAPPAGLPAIDYGARAAGYLDQLQSREPTALHTGMAQQLAARRAALARPERLCSCHHDLHHRNLVDTGDAIYVLDWEYAGPGDPLADLASCVSYHAPGPAGVDALLAGYGSDSGALRERLAALGWIFDCLWYGWNGVARRAGLECDGELQRRLIARLAA